jgi:plasmid stabilization system protein ParE
MWGDRQRDIYAEKLAAGLDTIAQYPELGAARDDLSAGLYARRVEHYIVYHRFTIKTLVVVRLRHIRAEPLRSSEL